jgi:indolepyruvate ferredoxin oxidoreductase beta subunit
MKKKINIVITGVGGQGVITASKILGKAAVNANLPVFVSEVHGMAQRGGTVICTVRMGDVFSALMASGTADAFISLEPVEALRYINFANPKTKIITDINPTIPNTVTVSGDKYPSLDDVFNEIEKYAKIYKINALDLARKSGGVITKNIVMLGALAGIDILPFSYEIFLATILENFPDKFNDINKKAFASGFNAINPK